MGNCSGFTPKWPVAVEHAGCAWHSYVRPTTGALIFVPPVRFVLKEVSLVVDYIYVELLSAICKTFKPKERVAAYDIFQFCEILVCNSRIAV